VLEEENKELIKSFIDEVFNKHSMAAIDKYLAAIVSVCRCTLYNTVCCLRYL
jgi:hypothetical protein